MKKFTRAFLTNVLGMDGEDIKVVMKYQRLFPELLKEEEGFCVNGRVLWEQLDKPYGGYATWVKQRVLKQGWAKNSDYSSLMKSQKRGIGGTISKEYYFTIEMAKHVAMMENTESGHLVRNYFIKMEKAIKGYQDHEAIRHPEKAGYVEMCKHVTTWYLKKHPEKSKEDISKFTYSNEANMLNRALLGKDAASIKRELDIEGNETREHLNIATNKALFELQMLNGSLLIAGMEYERRKAIVEDTCRAKHNSLRLKIIKELDIAA